MTEQLVIYKLGETHIQTTITNGYADYTKGKRPEAYLDELGSGFVCIPIGQAIELIEKAGEKKYIKPWEEITEEKWEDWLTVLPPEKWKTIDGVNIFRISERQTGNITRHCAEYQGKYYTANRRTSDNYKALALEIKLTCHKMATSEMAKEMINELPLERQQEYY